MSIRLQVDAWYVQLPDLSVGFLTHLFLLNKETKQKPDKAETKKLFLFNDDDEAA